MVHPDKRPLNRVKWHEELDQPSNYGELIGAIVRVAMPEVEFDEYLPAYANSHVVRITRAEGSTD